LEVIRIIVGVNIGTIQKNGYVFLPPRRCRTSYYYDRPCCIRKRSLTRSFAMPRCARKRCSRVSSVVLRRNRYIVILKLKVPSQVASNFHRCASACKSRAFQIIGCLLNATISYEKPFIFNVITDVVVNFHGLVVYLSYRHSGGKKATRLPNSVLLNRNECGEKDEKKEKCSCVGKKLSPQSNLINTNRIHLSSQTVRLSRPLPHPSLSPYL